MTLRLNLRQMLLFSFVALGPIGNMLTPHVFPSAMRSYYFLLPLFPLFFINAREKLIRLGAIFLPLLIYSCISAVLVESFADPNEPLTAFRFLLLFCQFFFVLGAASSLKTQDEAIKTIYIYLGAYLISLLIGYLFFIGYYLHVIPLTLIERFSVLTQFGFTLLRFSPGSYPNEYGIVSSFALSILTLLALEKKKLWLIPIFILTLLALLLTTTRAAYLAYFFSLFYLLWKSKSFFKASALFSLALTAIFAALSFFKFNMFKILSIGFRQSFHEGSLGERYLMWLRAIEKGKEHLFFGSGFGSLTNIHNVYLQLFVELGLIGSILLCVSLLASFFNSPREQASAFLKKVQMVGLIHVLFFAASNHNLNHHLTWFVLFLTLALKALPLKKEPSLSSLQEAP